MKHSLALMALCVAFAAGAQTFWPYNPDSDNDGIISVEDLMSILTVFGTEWTLDADSSQAYTLSLYEAGIMPRGACAGTCKSVGGIIPIDAELMMWDSALMNLPFTYPLNTSNQWGLMIWSFVSGGSRVNNAIDDGHVLYRRNEYNDEDTPEWVSFKGYSIYPHRPHAHCICIGAVPNPAFAN